MTSPTLPRPTRAEIRTVVASSVLGTTVEWYDFFLYGIAAGLVFHRLFFPNADQIVGTLLAFATFAIGFVARPVGGLIFGHIGDRVGRKKTLVATMIIMGLATFLIGLVPSYDTIGIGAPILLVLLRLAQGAAIGGEWGGAVLMAVEYAPRSKRGYYGSLPQLGLALGLMLGTGVFAGLNSVMSSDAFLAFGWRIAFMLSLILVAVGTFVRLKVMETPAFRGLEKIEARSSLPALEMVRNPQSRRNLLLGMGSRWAEGVAFNTWAVFGITYGTNVLRLSRQTILISVMAAAATMVLFIPWYGRLSDHYDRRRLFTLGVVISTAATYPAFSLLGTQRTSVVVITIIVMLGVLYPMMYAPQPSLYAELFPTRVRYTGISVVYQLSGIVASGLTPLLLTYLLKAAGGTTSMIMVYVFVIGVISAASAMAIRRRDVDGETIESPTNYFGRGRRRGRQRRLGGVFRALVGGWACRARGGDRGRDRWRSGGAGQAETDSGVAASAGRKDRSGRLGGPVGSGAGGTLTALGVPTVRRSEVPARTPTSGPLVDTYGRAASDLRVSLTDRCNLRCRYCMPAEGLDWLRGDQLLRPDELVRLMRIAVTRLNVTSVRFTGGEPLLSRHLEEVIAAAAALAPRPEISLTTNGVGLAPRAAALARAGLNRVNVSLDSVDPHRFAAITRRSRLDDVLAGLASAAAVGLTPVKVNAVLDPATGRQDVVALLRFCLLHDFQLRVIEQMPLDAGHQWRRDAALTADDVLAALRAHFRLRPDPTPRGSAPAQLWLVDAGRDTPGGKFGIIASVSHAFCSTCDRTRLTADGQIRSCLFSAEEADLRSLLRGGADDDAIELAWRAAMWAKPAGHAINNPDFAQPARPMSAIGG